MRCRLAPRLREIGDVTVGRISNRAAGTRAISAQAVKEVMIAKKQPTEEADNR
jgi:hypothetical protein